MRLMGLDLGEKRIGLAISDTRGLIAQSRPPVDGCDRKKAAREIAAMVSSENVGEVVVGLPLNMDGSEGPSALKARKFGDMLAELTGVPVTLWDERLTTKEAEKIMLMADVSRSKRKKAIDGLAAVLILQSYLDSRTGGDEGKNIDEL
ncbi:MAG: Holliday junction resolvase RuvX [Candidatus Omnitrophica bacterium]|nr:Holliday junction resolvase RuvX [Candidatus Omnitrophota bacterium]MDD4012972.1 Holliday junction resolvase RuvX [Candidatus Omnitrophota bacterium]